MAPTLKDLQTPFKVIFKEAYGQDLVPFGKGNNKLADDKSSFPDVLLTFTAKHKHVKIEYKGFYNGETPLYESLGSDAPGQYYVKYSYTDIDNDIVHFKESFIRQGPVEEMIVVWRCFMDIFGRPV